MKEITFEIEGDLEEGGYVAEAFVTEDEHIVTQGDTIDELKSMIKNALECHFDNPLDVPHKVVMNFRRQEVFAF
jgi:predicted RNase H-like HicB family nuclease